MAASPPSLAGPREPSPFADLVLRHGPLVQRLLRGLLDDPAAAVRLTRKTFLRAHALRSAASAYEDDAIWLVRVALHLGLAEPHQQGAAARALPASSEMVRVCFLLGKGLELPAEKLGRILHLSARRADRYAERARREVTSLADLDALSGSGAGGASYEERLATLRQVLTSGALRPAELDRLLEEIAQEVTETPAAPEGTASALLRAPVLDEEDRSSERAVKAAELDAHADRAARRASLRRLSEDAATLTAPPTTRRSLAREREESGRIQLMVTSSEPPGVQQSVAAPVADAALSSETPSATPAVLSVAQPPAPTAPRRLPWLAAFVGVAAVAAMLGVLATRPARLTPVDNNPVAAAVVPAVQSAEAPRPEPQPTTIDPTELPVETASSPDPLDKVQSAPTAPPKSVAAVGIAAPTPPPVPQPAPVPAPTAGDPLQAAMQGAVGTAAPAARADADAVVVPTDAPRRPPQGAVTAALAKVTGAAKRCIGPDDPISRATVVFGSAGAVQSVVVTGHAVGTAAQGCIESALRSARVPAFTDSDYRATVTIRP